jgi:NAD(P)H dehydrogenase (quinone)
LTGNPPEDFETIARRYVAASPLAIRGLAGVMREVGGLAAALLARTPDISKMETRLGAPRISNFALATDSQAWRTTHA